MEAEILTPKELVSIPQADTFALTIKQGLALEFFTTPNAVDPVLEAIRKEIDGFSADVSTVKGRKEVASMAYKISQSKTYLENVGKELAAAQKEIPKKIDAARKQIRDTLDAWRDEVRAPLSAWEAAEEARIQRHNETVNELEHAGREPGDCPSLILREALDWVESVEIGPACEEFEAAYARAKDGARARLLDAIERAEKREAEQEELERLRKEAAERAERERIEKIEREAAEKARLEAERKAQEEIEKREAAARAEKEAIEAKAKADREEAERRELDAKIKAEEERLAAERRELELRKQAEDAERRAREAEERAKRDAEEAKRREEEEARRREADKAHRAKVNNAAVAGFVAGGMAEDAAKLAVALIAKRAVPGVSIQY